jgi:hypothetical protein
MSSAPSRFREILEDAGIEFLSSNDEIDDAELKYEVAETVKSGLSPFVYVHDIPKLIKHSLLDPEQHGKAYFFTGPSAIGKTDAVNQGFMEAALEMGREGIFREMHVSQMVISDVTGIPREGRRPAVNLETGEYVKDPATGEVLMVGDGRTVFYPPQAFALQQSLPLHQQAYERFRENWKKTGNADWSIMTGPEGHRFPLYGYFWDEVTNPSTPATVHQCFSLWYGNKVAEHRLVGDAFHVLAGNRPEDQTNSIPLARSAASRVCIIPAVPSLAGWLSNWGLKMQNVGGQEQTREHPAVITFLHNNSRYFAPNTSGFTPMSAFPSPRTWSFVSRDLYSNDRNPLPANLLTAKIAGHVGNDAAQLFATFLTHWERMIDVRKLLDSPQKGDGPFGWLPQSWPKEMDLRMMMALQMMSMVDKGNAQRFMHFMMDEEKFQPEMIVLIIKLMNQSGKLAQVAEQWATLEFAQWAMKYKGFVL